MPLVTICSDFGVPKIKSVTVSTVSPSVCHEVMGQDNMILVFWMLSSKPNFSLCYFSFIKRLFSLPLFSAIRVVSHAYQRILIFLLTILIPACASSSPAFLMMYSVYKLNKQGDNILPFPIGNQSVVSCPVLTVAYWPAYRFLRRQVKWPGTPISLSIFHSLLWSTQSKALAWSIKQWITINCGKFWKTWEYQTTWPASWEICMQVRKQQLELDMEQQTGSK